MATSPQTRADIPRLIRLAATWRRRVGELVTNLIEQCVESYSVDGHAAQYRWLRATLEGTCDRYAEATLGMSMDAFTETVLQLRQGLTPMDVSVVIPTAGKWKWSRLRRTLSALARQELRVPVRWHIILVFDGVTPPADVLARAGDVPVHVIHLPERRGRGAARNAGIAASKAEVVVLLDDDVVVSRDFVDAHWEQQRQGASLCHGPVREVPVLACFDDIDELTLDPRVARDSFTRLRAVAQRIVSELDDVERSWETVGSRSRLERDGTAALVERRMPAAWIAFAGANLSAPRRWFVENGFDERPGARWGLEDVSLALRWALAGRPLSCAALARGLHLSHYRHNWKAEQRANRACLDFVAEDTAQTVLDYLEGEQGVSAVEAALLPYFEMSRHNPRPVA